MPTTASVLAAVITDSETSLAAIDRELAPLTERHTALEKRRSSLNDGIAAAASDRAAVLARGEDTTAQGKRIRELVDERDALAGAIGNLAAEIQGKTEERDVAGQRLAMAKLRESALEARDRALQLRYQMGAELLAIVTTFSQRVEATRGAIEQLNIANAALVQNGGASVGAVELFISPVQGNIAMEIANVGRHATPALLVGERPA